MVGFTRYSPGRVFCFGNDHPGKVSNISENIHPCFSQVWLGVCLKVNLDTSSKIFFRLGRCGDKPHCQVCVDRDEDPHWHERKFKM